MREKWCRWLPRQFKISVSLCLSFTFLTLRGLQNKQSFGLIKIKISIKHTSVMKGKVKSMVNSSYEASLLYCTSEPWSHSNMSRDIPWRELAVTRFCRGSTRGIYSVKRLFFQFCICFSFFRKVAPQRATVSHCSFQWIFVLSYECCYNQT